MLTKPIVATVILFIIFWGGFFVNQFLPKLDTVWCGTPAVATHFLALIVAVIATIAYWVDYACAPKSTKRNNR